MREDWEQVICGLLLALKFYMYQLQGAPIPVTLMSGFIVLVVVGNSVGEEDIVNMKFSSQ
ncbi:hypothetical protein ALT761_00929 [Alteromonas sp. 76-1]|nr:hypothetical protein ALT761_00929 [Alteromonas sp. 76-1]